ncbi:MAG: hypothetical protein ACPHL6_11115 [Rubripirellula sp.]
MILVIVNTDLAETNHDEGIAVVPFQSWKAAYDYAEAVIKHLDNDEYRDASQYCDDIHDLLDRWNDKCFERHAVKLQSGFNTAGHVLGEDLPPLASIKTTAVNVPLADKQ